jgi:hypothetical protein|tara:strand:- start:10734 stop:11030 length:297 start_codon:yes stop_codon:yes gene_type:complete
MKFKKKPFFITVTNKLTKQFCKEYLVDGIAKDSVTQTIIATCSIDPLTYDLHIEEATIEQANSYIDDKFPNGQSKHIVVDKKKRVVEILYHAMGNPYG